MNSNAQKKDDNNNQMNFSADVSRLLNIVANALYTNHDVFLRELISNAADACDRLRYDAIQKPDLIKDNPNFRIHVYKDIETRTLTVVDNGIGMGKAELIDHLGTIAKSGTAALMEKMKSKSGDESDPLKLIGQFGVGFYAAYMVADFVTVISRKAGSASVWVWESDGATGFNVRKATKDEEAKLDGERGTLGRRLTVASTSSTVKGLPSKNFTLRRSLNSQVVGSTAFQLSARPGPRVCFASCDTRVS